MAERKDHRPFLGLRKELRYGRTAAGDLAAIDDVRRGAACDCVCPACGGALIARKGDVLIAHFAHAGGGRDGCGMGRETNAHIWAKQTLERELHIRLPDVSAAIGDRSRLVKKGRDFAFVKAALETRLDAMTPDVVLTAPDGRSLIVEVRVTHASDAEKVSRIRDHGVSAIEVDLYPWRHCEDEDEVREALLSRADRHWLFNPAIDLARDTLRAELAAEAAHQAAAEKRKGEAAVRRLRGRPLQRPAALLEMLETVVVLGLGRLAVGVKADDGFITPGPLWKAAALVRLFRAAPVFGPLGQVTVDRLEDLLQDCLAPEFRSGARWDRAPKGLAVAFPGYRSPRVAIEMFLEQLISADILYYRKGDHWLGEAWPKRLAAAEAQTRREAEAERRRVARLGELEDLFEAIDGVCGEETRSAFATWRRAPLPGSTRSPEAVAAEDAEAWVPVREALAAVLAMLRGGPPTPELMGLPFDKEREAAIRETELIAAQEAMAQAEAERRAGEDRVLRLRVAARRELGDLADEWCAQVKDGADRESQARHDEAGFEVSLRALDNTVRELHARRQAQEALDALHAVLRDATARAYDSQRADLFLRTTRPDLGQISPLAFCVDERTLRICLSLLPGALARRAPGAR